jgi:DNA-binding beta-propeller fold protein YncE
MTRRVRRLAGALAALATLAIAASAAPALADPPPGHGFGNGAPVFVQTDGLSGNQVVVYQRRQDGTLTPAGTYATGGLGGQLTGSVVDHTASQSALTYDREDGLLLAVNAGSNTISVFSVFGPHLQLRQVIGSGGAFPVSVTARHGEVFVLNAEEGGSIQGFGVAFGRLVRIPALHRSLGSSGTEAGEAEQFTHTPGQVAFTPDGSKLVVTTKAGGQSIDVFKLTPFGGLAPAPVVTSDPTVPFAVAFDQEGHLLVAEAAGALASFRINSDGSLTGLSSVATEQAATCWLTPALGFFYTSNAGSATLSGFRDGFGGQLTLLGNTGTDAGTVDGASAGRNLYVQAGKEGIVDEFTVTATGALERIGAVVVPGGAGGEGIAAG